MSRFTRFFRVNFPNPGTVSRLCYFVMIIILIMLVVSKAVRRSRRRIAASKGMGGLVRERPRIFVRSWWGWGPQDDSTKSWWLGSRSWLFIINMIIKIIMIIFVIIIIWFRAHGRGESVLCLCADGKIRPGGSGGPRSNQTSEFQDKDTFITMFIVLSWWSL